MDDRSAAVTDHPEKIPTWITVITREHTPQVLTWTDELGARAHFAKWSAQWSESYLARIVVGVGPNQHEQLHINDLATLVQMGIEERARVRAALAPLLDALNRQDDAPDDAPAEITVGMLRAVRDALER